MTLDGTNSYLIFGTGEAICIDPGPDIPAHVARLQRDAFERNARIVAICLTHGHPDHAPAAEPLARATGATIYAFDPRHGGVTVREGARVTARDVTLEVVEAPGHTPDSVAYYEARERALFTGDTVLGSGTVAIAPPDGDMRVYQATLVRLLERFGDARRILGGHGEPVTDVRGKLREYVRHRQARESEILAALAGGERTIPEIVREVYAGVDPRIWPVAGRQVLAYLIALEAERRVASRESPVPVSAADEAIANPDWTKLATPDDARVLEAELGASRRGNGLRAYRLR